MSLLKRILNVAVTSNNNEEQERITEIKSYLSLQKDSLQYCTDSKDCLSTSGSPHHIFE